MEEAVRLLGRLDTPVFQDEEPRTLFEATRATWSNRRDKALLAALLYSFARAGAVVGLKIRDYEHQRRRAYLAVQEKRGQHCRIIPLSTAKRPTPWTPTSRPRGLDRSPEVPF